MTSPQLPKYMPTRSSKAFKKTSFCCSDAAIMIQLRYVVSNSQWLLFSHTQNNFSMTLTHTKKIKIHIEEYFADSIYAKTKDILK